MKAVKWLLGQHVEVKAKLDNMIVSRHSTSRP